MTGSTCSAVVVVAVAGRRRGPRQPPISVGPGGVRPPTSLTGCHRTPPSPDWEPAFGVDGDDDDIRFSSLQQ